LSEALEKESLEDYILESSNLKCEVKAKLKLKRLIPERYIYVGKSFSSSQSLKSIL
jgi:hypothetical protein